MEIAEIDVLREKLVHMEFELNKLKREKTLNELNKFNKGYRSGQRDLFDKFDKYSCIKNDKWYLDYKKKQLEGGTE